MSLIVSLPAWRAKDKRHLNVTSLVSSGRYSTSMLPVVLHALVGSFDTTRHFNAPPRGTLDWTDKEVFTPDIGI